MLIGQIVRKSGCSRDTIRYYERRGLLLATNRRDNRYKEYLEETLARLRFIRTMQDVGFTLREIADFIDLYDNRNATCENVGPKVAERLRGIDRLIADLTRMRDDVALTFSECQSNPRTQSCKPIERMLGVIAER